MSFQTYYNNPFLLSIFISIVVFAYTPPASADCIACFELKGVRIQMKDGHRLSGYVRWNASRFDMPGPDSGFPDILLDAKAWASFVAKNRRESLVLYKKVFPVSRYLLKHLLAKKVLLTTQSETLTL